MNEERWKNGMGIVQSFLILGGLMVVGLFLTSSLIALISKGDLTRSDVIWSSVAQNILAFILPAIVLPYFIGHRPGYWLNYKPHGTVGIYVGILLMLIVSLPLISIIAEMNQAIHLPEGLSPLEETMRKMEERGSESTKLVLENNTAGQLILSVLTVGILTGIGEEMFFRGGVQNILTRFGVSPGIAIIVGAIIFSAAHFQFFGFVPRLILGSWFGWLYWRYNSIVPAATAHALNNTAVIMSSWLIERGYLPSDFEMLGMAGANPIITFIVSIALCLIVYRLFFDRKPVTSKNIRYGSKE